MKVCVVVSGHPAVTMGGAQYQAHLLAQELGRGDGVSVTYLSKEVPNGEIAAQLPYSVRRIGDESTARRRALLLDAPSLWESLCQIQPDVIYQRMKQSYTGICARYARARGIPFFFHVASITDLSTRLLPRRLSMDMPLKVAETALGNWGIRNASHVIVQNQVQAQTLTQTFGREPTRIVYNFQPLPQSLPQKSPDRLRVLWVGNIKAQKRPEMFLALARAFADHPEMEFWMVGRPSQNREHRQLMSDLQNTANLRYFGAQPLEKVNELMSQADIFVATSPENTEGFPNTFIQAWAHGAVLVSTIDIDGGLNEMGVGFRVRDFEELRAVIAKLAGDPEYRRHYAVRGFEHVHRTHSMKNAAELANLVLETARRNGSA